jgi:hypothetical protein
MSTCDNNVCTLTQSAPVLTPPCGRRVTFAPVNMIREFDKHEPIRCSTYSAPWPAILVAIIGLGIMLYTIFATNVTPSRNIFGGTLIFLWTLVWFIILWVLWKQCYTVVTWWICLIPISLTILFAILLITFNFGAY